MASEEHLRREILKLSSLIAKNSPAPGPSRPNGSYSWRNPNPAVVSLPKHPNPFDQFRNNEYLNDCFPDIPIIASSDTTAKPNSVYVNPEYLAKTGVRPHINRTHSTYQVLSSTITKNVAHLPPSSPCPGPSSGTSAPPIANSVATTKTKYKLDRRLKRSPTRKLSKSRLPVGEAKLVKRYSMRVVPMLKWHSVKKPSPITSYKPYKMFVKVVPRLRPTAVVKRGGKSLVNINGAKFISKNGGKTLRRLSTNGNVVSINGNYFVAKNRGKTIKRVSESSFSKLKSTPSTQSTGVRLASRAIQKSKLTLTQRVWKKKQFCMFYNRLGECKRKDNGTCPYKHDPKHLMICPKFIVGKCVAKDCKLSHDLKIGRLPPCQFFNKSNCSRDNCPYPHIKSSPTKKSSKSEKKQSTETPTNGDLKKSARKRLLSVRKDGKTKKKLEKARYYQQAPDSQPIVAIVPRRVRPTEQETRKLDPGGATVKVEVESQSDCESAASSQSSDKAVDPRRARLMSRIYRLQENMRKKESTAPQFLPLQ